MKLTLVSSATQLREKAPDARRGKNVEGDVQVYVE
jgi:hypothetical protein